MHLAMSGYINYGYEVGLASKSDVSPNTRADEICRESIYLLIKCFYSLQMRQTLKIHLRMLFECVCQITILHLHGLIL